MSSFMNMSTSSAPAANNGFPGKTRLSLRKPGSASNSRQTSNRSLASNCNDGPQIGLLSRPDSESKMAPQVHIDMVSAEVTPVESQVTSRENSTNLKPEKSSISGRSTRASSQDLTVDRTLAQAARKLSICSQVSEVNAQEIATALHDFDTDINPDHHALAKTWGLWEKRAWTDRSLEEDEWHYRQNCKAIKEFSTIESFMELFNGMPLPSAILDKKQMVRNFPTESSTTHPLRQPKQRRGSILGDVPLMKEQTLDCVMFFEQGVFPSWEDPAHKDGGKLQFMFKSDFPAHAIDQVWENVVFSVMGNTFGRADAVTGVRLCDRLNADVSFNLGATGPRTAVRMEIWHKELDNDDRGRLLNDLRDVLTQELLCGGHAKTVGKVKRSVDAQKIVMSYAAAPSEADAEGRKVTKRSSV